MSLLFWFWRKEVRPGTPSLYLVGNLVQPSGYQVGDLPDGHSGMMDDEAETAVAEGGVSREAATDFDPVGVRPVRPHGQHPCVRAVLDVGKDFVHNSKGLRIGKPGVGQDPRPVGFTSGTFFLKESGCRPGAGHRDTTA